LFFNISAFIYRHKYLALVFALGLTALLAFQLKDLRIESSIESFFHKDDPTYITYENFLDDFGKDDFFLVSLRPADVFTKEFLISLKDIHQSIEKNVPHIEKVTSLANVRYTRGKDEQLIVEKLLEKIPQSPNELDDFKKEVLKNPLYLNFLITADGKMTSIVLEPKAFLSAQSRPTETREYIQMFTAIKAIVEPLKKQGLEVHYGGSPVIVTTLESAIMADLNNMVPLSFLLVAILLALMFKKIAGVIYPFLIVFISLLSTMGTMAWLDIPLTNITSILPMLLIIVGVADAVHILAVFYRKYAISKDKRESICQAFSHSGLAVLMTSLTTSAGLLSFVTADIASIADFGLAAPISVMYAFLYTLLLLPALVAIFPLSPPKPIAEDYRGRIDGLLVRIGQWSVQRAGLVIGVFGLVLVVSILGIFRLDLAHNILNWFDDDHPLRASTSMIDREFKGTVPIEVIIDTGKENGLYDAKLIKRLESSAKKLEKYQSEGIRVGRTVSLTTIIKEVNRALHQNQDEFYKIPDDSQLIAQELLLFEMSGNNDLERLVSINYRKVRFTMLVPFKDALVYQKVVKDIQAHFTDNYPEYQVTITGLITLFSNTVSNILSSISKSYTFALIIISLFMFIMLGSIRIGLISMLPNLIPILAMFGLMGWLDIPFDVSSMLIGSLAIGLAVDDTIHFLHVYQKNRAENHHVEPAVEQTMLYTGKAIFITTATLAAGFFVFTLAALISTRNFGILAGCTVILALVADYFLTPALMKLNGRH
jgi:predicted RND superfamily exporter protein